MITAEQVGAALTQPEMPEVRVLRPQPGDVLVVRLPGVASEYELEQNRELIEELVGNGVKVLVLAEGSSLDVIRKDGD